MVERIYLTLWVMLTTIVGVFMYRKFEPKYASRIRFIIFGLIFMEMFGVLPNWASHEQELKH